MVSNIIHEYEEILIGNQTKYLKEIFQCNDEDKEKIALEVFHYAFEVYLRWSPEDVQEYISDEILDKMKLTNLLKYIQFPAELSKKKNLDYLVDILYPQLTKMDFKASIITTYKKVLNAKDGTKLPKGYLNESLGMMRGHICLQYVLSEYFNFDSTEELYGFFASSNGMKTLKKYRLSSMCVDFYNTPLDFLHNALPKSQQNEFLYYYYKFKNANQKLKHLIEKNAQVSDQNVEKES